LDNIERRILETIRKAGELGFNELCEELRNEASRNTVRKKLDELIRDGYVEERKGRRGQKSILTPTETSKKMSEVYSKINHLYDLVAKLVREKKEFKELWRLRECAEDAFDTLEHEVLKCELPKKAKNDVVLTLLERRESVNKLILSALLNLETDEIREAKKGLLEAAAKVGIKTRTYDEIIRELEGKNLKS
jgi:DNA-binding Lrp family transcriptional regulator